MRVAIHNPLMIFTKANHTLCDYVVEYIRKYKPLIYLSEVSRNLRFWFWSPVSLTPRQVISQLKKRGIKYSRDKIITGIDDLNKKADVLLGFNNEPFFNTPEKKFTGIKIYHTQDYQSYSRLCYNALKKAGVDYVFCTGQLDKYSVMFRRYFPGYVGKVISFPFGFGKRFKDTVPFAKREKKVFVTGSINPINITDQPMKEVVVTINNKLTLRKTSLVEQLKYFLYYHCLIREHTRDLEKFLPGKKWAHPFRRALVKREKEFSDIINSFLPVYPRIKSFDVDMVKEMNRHQMILVDDGLIDIVGAKVYEGMACGGVLICPDLPMFNEFGFEHGKNCIKYKKMNFKDFRAKVEYYLAHQKELKKIRDAGQKYVLKNFNHEAIADMIQQKVKKKYEDWSS